MTIPSAALELPAPAELDGRALLHRARHAVRMHLGYEDPPLPRAPVGEPLAALFVTIRRHDGQLHGCIGTVDATLPLSVAVEKYAVLAAFDDPRTRRLRPEEIDDVVFEVSVLTAPVPLPCEGEEDACRKLVPGVDGVVLTAGARRGLFLPQVWESLPDPHAFLRQLHVKAGLPGRWDPRTQLERFTVQKFHEPGFDRGND